MRSMQGYTQLTGLNGAFGWGRRSPEGRVEMTLGGLKKCESYTLAGKERIRTDESGSWHGSVRDEVPLYVAQCGDGKLMLYNEERTDRQAAALLARRFAEKRKPAAVPEKKPETAIPHKEPEKAVVYRTRLSDRAIDALPKLVWPPKEKKIRPYFEKNRPIRVLDAPAWHFVQVQGSGVPCYAGYRVQEDRVCEVAWAVQARGAMLPPNGMQGYRYTRCAVGACWLMTKSV